MAETPRADTGDFECRSWHNQCSIVLMRQGNLSITGTFLISSLPPLIIVDKSPNTVFPNSYLLWSSFSNRWVHLDTVSRQILRDIQETQFSGSKIEVHVHLKNAFPGGIGNRRITFGYNFWVASHPSPSARGNVRQWRWRVPGLPIRAWDCARGYNNCGHTQLQMSAIDVTVKIILERLYLVPGIGTFGPWVNFPYAPTTPTVYSTNIARFLCNSNDPSFFWSSRFTK